MRLQRYATAARGWHVLLVWMPDPSKPNEIAGYAGALLESPATFYAKRGDSIVPVESLPAATTTTTTTSTSTTRIKIPIEDRIAQLDSFGVALAHRRRGIGRALLRAVESLMAQRCVKRVDVVLRSAVGVRLVVPSTSKPTPPRADSTLVVEDAAARLLLSEGYKPRRRLVRRAAASSMLTRRRRILQSHKSTRLSCGPKVRVRRETTPVDAHRRQTLSSRAATRSASSSPRTRRATKVRAPWRRRRCLTAAAPRSGRRLRSRAE